MLLIFNLKVTPSVISSTQSTIDAKQYWDSILYSSSSHIFTGIVLSVEPKWTEIDGVETIVSYASVSISESIKGEAGSQITLVYKGGTVGNMTLKVFRNPWGLIECHIGDWIKVFARQDERELDTFRAISVEVISRTETETRTLQAPELYVYEYYRVGFEYTGPEYDGGNPAEYWINELGTEDIPDGENDEFQAVKNSFQTWEDEPLSYKEYTYRDTTDRLNGRDDWNVVCWRDMGYWDGTIAETYIYEIWPWGKWHEFDILFNDYRDWGIGDPDRFDVQNVGTHEAGHTLGLRDLYLNENYYQTMFWDSYHETWDRSLESGDRAGIQYIYPQYEQPTVSIERPGDYQWVTGLVEIVAAVSSPSGINWVKYHAFDEYGQFYSSNWVSMWYDSGIGRWVGLWWTGDAPAWTWYKILVRVESGQGMFGYDLVYVYVYRFD